MLEGEFAWYEKAAAQQDLYLKANVWAIQG